MRLRRILVLLAVGGLLGVLPVGMGAGPAEADETCLGVLTVPPRWGLSPTTDEWWDGWSLEQTGTCSEVQSYYKYDWEAVGAGGVGYLNIEAVMEACGTPLLGPGFGRFTTPPPVGALTITGTGTSMCDPSLVMPATTATMDVRVTSKASVGVSRSGRKVTIAAHADRYYTSTGAWGRWNQATGVIQYRTSSTGAWVSLKNAVTANGVYRYTYTTTAKRQYRVLWPNATYIWGVASAASATV